MRIVFFNIAQMYYYKGIHKSIDEPQYGGDYVLQTGDAHEKHNFDPTEIDGKNICLGFFETKTTSKISNSRNQLHIEKIDPSAINDDTIEDVLIVWCAKYHDNRTVVVGWYNHATIYRYYRSAQFDSGYMQDYNCQSLTEHCVLLPYSMRNSSVWWVPRKKSGRTYGFGQANVWFASEDTAKPYVEKLVKSISDYRDENWLYKYPQ